MNAKTKLQNNWMELLNRKFDLLTGLPKADQLLGRLTLGTLDPDDIPDIRVHSERPTFEDTKSSKIGKLKLKDLERFVLEAEATPPHRMAETIAPDLVSRTTISVSEIESLAQETDTLPAHFSGDKSQSDTNIESASRFGSLVHGILEHIDFSTGVVSQESLAALATTAASSLDEQPTKAESQHAIDLCTKFLSSSIAEELCRSRQLYRELPFMLKWEASNISIQGTIDCLFQDEQEKWNLIDYKTGSVAGNQKAILSHYGVQLAIYASAIARQIGSLPKSTRLILLREPIEVIEIEWTDEIMTKISKRINNVIQELHTPSL